MAVALGLALGGPPAHAQGEPELADMSMEELLDLEVEVGSKSKERISDAPASITAWAHEDLDALGYHTLHELADFTAGYSSTVMYGERVLETRGQKAGSFNNNKHLTYFDGIPINHARNFKAPIDQELPLYAAERVELLRGPASALYGTSAFFGVINVVPRERLAAGAEAQARLGFGSRDGERLFSGNAYLTDGDGRFRLSLATYDKAASRAHVGLRDDEHNLFWDDQKSVFLNAAYTFVDSPLAGLTVAFLYFRKNGGLGESWNENASSHELNDLTWETLIPYARYRRELADDVTLHAHVLWNTGREKGWFVNANAMQQDMYDGTGVPLGGYDAHTENLAGQAEVHWTPGEDTRMIAGVTGDARQQIGASRSYGYAVSADPGPPFLRDASVARGSDLYGIYSFYLQLRHELPVLEGLIVSAGARDDLSVSPAQDENQISPRLGLVQRLPWNLSLKLFYGTALRAPGLKEIGLNNESRTSLERMGLPTDGIRDLESETIRSLEGGVGYNDEHVSLSATAFANRTERSLDGVTYMGVNIFRNGSGETDSLGGEIEAQVAPWRELRFLASYAWSEALDDAGHELEDIPRHKTNLGVIYRVGDLAAAATLRWVSGYRTPHGPDTGGTVLVDANLGWSFSSRFRAELAGRNLTDEETKLPKHGRQDVPQTGARVLVSLIIGY